MGAAEVVSSFGAGAGVGAVPMSHMGAGQLWGQVCHEHWVQEQQVQKCEKYQIPQRLLF